MSEKRKLFSSEDAKEFNDLHNKQRKSLREIARMYETSHGVIRRTLSKHGYEHRTRQYSVNESFFENIDSPEKHYVLGWIYSNGCVFYYEDKRYAGFSIKIQKQDKYILEYIRELLSAEVPIGTEKIKGKYYVKLKIGSKKMYNDLLKYGLKPRKTHDLKYPTDIITNHPAFILGCFDGDGAITIDKNTKKPYFEFTGTKNMVETIRDILVQELGLTKVQLNKKKNSYSVSYSGTNVVNKIGKWLYSWNPEVYLYRKRERFNKLLTIPKYGNWVAIYKCPNCEKQDVFPKRNMYQLKKYTFGSRFCSLKCSGQFYRKYQLNDYQYSPEMALAIKENIIGFKKEYKVTDSNGKFKPLEH